MFGAVSMDISPRFAAQLEIDRISVRRIRSNTSMICSIGVDDVRHRTVAIPGRYILASQVSEWMGCAHTSCSWRSEGFEDMQLCSVMEPWVQNVNLQAAFIYLLKVLRARKKPS